MSKTKPANTPHPPVPPLKRTAFKTVAEMVAYSQANNARADALVKPWQAALTWGDKAAYEFAYADGNTTTIYFEIKRSTFREDRWREDEIFERRVSGWGYSVFCPDGEYGTTHRAQFERKLTEAEWAEAMQQIKDVGRVYAAVTGQR